MSIFDATNNAKNQIRVNKFDWSHANNFSTELGRITPIFCDLVPAHMSFGTTPTLGLQFMPMVFPIQTRMKARVYFFKYPLRALWKDYMDYVGNYKAGLVEPYHDFKNQIPQTGDLFDYLGLPTTFVGGYGSYDTASAISNSSGLTWLPANSGFDILSNAYALEGTNLGISYNQVIFSPGTKYKVCRFDCQLSRDEFSIIIPINSLLGNTLGVLLYDIDGNCLIAGHAASSGSDTYFISTLLDSSKLKLTLNSGNSNYTQLLENFKKGVYHICLLASKDGTLQQQINSIDYLSRTFSQGVQPLTAETNPYYDSSSANKEKQLKISAYAARAYEGIYNSYFRYDRNNPYYLNGEVQYNRWLPTYDGGVDETLYKLHYSNWEKDFLTTAVQSPQQGVAPLVGITTYEDVQTNADGTVTTQQRVALVDEDGRKFGLDFDSDDEGLNDVRYTELKAGQVVQKPRSLINLVQSGISINDLRNVNAYQKYLELNMRAGYSYKDIIEQRFNVKVRYSDLLMPEFIGGFSEDIEMHSVTQNVETNDTGSYAGALGSQAGLAGCRRTGRRISCFCDEESIILGLVVVTPLPVYSQLLPKHFLYRELLDHYQPEFNNIGYQPITYKEVCPIQAYNEKPESLNDTFGYQRPWYEYVQKYDTAHGLFRTSLRNFLMNRTFNVKPELSQSFLVVDPEQLNDVFSVTETTDKIYGQVRFEATAKLPISRVAIPKLD